MGLHNPAYVGGFFHFIYAFISDWEGSVAQHLS